VTTGGLTPQTLTSDRARLLRAVNQGDWSTIISPEQQEIVGKYDPLSDGRCLCGLCVLETVTNLAMAAREAPLRNKLLLFIGSSVVVQSGPRPGNADVGCDKRLEEARQTMFDALARSHLTVHSIDPVGLDTPMCQGSCNGKSEQNGPAMRLQNCRDVTVQRLQDQGSLGILPERTGGRTVMNTNAPQEKVPEIFHESDTYYVLAYEPSDPSGKESRRSIEVKVARTGAHVSTARYAPPAPGATGPARLKGASPPPIELALAGLLPDARVPLTMAVAAFASADGSKAYVDVNVNASALKTDDAPPLDIALAVLDQRGRRISLMHGTGATTLPGDLHAQVLLPSGDYELRVAVQARGADRAASIFSPLLVPSFGDAPLSMSDIVLGTRRRPESEGGGPPLIPIVTSSARTFSRGEAALAFLEVYQGIHRSDALGAIPIRTTIENADGHIVREESATLEATAFRGRRAGVPLTLPIGSLAPGRYRLRVSAARDSHTLTRAVAFMVE
jgi:VWFA-related protein